MSAFHTKFGMNDVLPDQVPTAGSFRAHLYGSTAVGGKRKKTRKNWKKRNATKKRKQRIGGKTWKKNGR